MSIDRRQRDIVEFIQKHKMAKVATLSKQFKVSPETIRKDLVELDDMGMLVRVHGGARINSRDRESAYSERESSYLEEKERLANLALDLIQDDSAVYLDYGTTTRTIAKALVDSGRRLTIVTNALPVADLVAKSDSIECMVLGGILRSNGGALYGPIGEKALEYLHFDMGFFSCGGVDAEAEITNHFPLEVVLSRKVSVATLSRSWGGPSGHTTSMLNTFPALSKRLSEPDGARATRLVPKVGVADWIDNRLILVADERHGPILIPVLPGATFAHHVHETKFDQQISEPGTFAAIFGHRKID